MTIDNDLKDQLIADVENICELNLKEETKISLKRCFEITIGCRIKTNENLSHKNLRGY